MEGKSTIKAVTPTISLAAYAVGDQLGDVKEIQNILDSSSDSVVTMSIVCIDKDKQKKTIDLLFFSDEPTVASSDNDALDIAASEMVAKYLGRVRINPSEYVDTANCSDATINVVGHLMKGLNTAKSTSLWVVAQIAETATYLSTDALTFKVGVLQD